jgi:DNA-binding HxlR family transcriptional regulator
MTPTYGQFCPIAMTCETLTERWTPLVVRELLCGSTRFNDLRRGVPLMSPSLLSARLKALQRVGVVERFEGEYRLTRAGEELRPIIDAMGVWGQRWARGDIAAKHLDASLLMWDVRRSVATEQLPDRRVVVYFHLRGSPDKKSHFWLIMDAAGADLCLTDPGHEVDVQVDTHVRTIVDYWQGRIELADAVRSGAMQLQGPRALLRSFPGWFRRSPFATVADP